MTSTQKAKGACLCGAVTVTTETLIPSVSACHCGTCRKWGSGPFMGVECAEGVSFTGDENITVFDSSEWAERGFCIKCGTHLFYRVKHNQHYHMPIGLFDLPAELSFDSQVFIDQKPAYYSFSNPTKELTGAQLFALFAPDSD